jgi:uncharacterized protein (TIGR00369 family)
MGEFGIPEVEALLKEGFAPWVQELGIEVAELTPTGGLFRLPENPRLSRIGGIVCGQAIGAVADTVSVLALWGVSGRFRNVTTVDMTTHFMRPLMAGGVEAVVEAVSNGRRMAVTRVEFRQARAEKIAAVATCAFAYLED